ncbi:hypothetical protein D3C80_1407710 [compost metagenome]
MANRFQVSHRQAPISSQMPHLRRILRTKVNGPLTASKVAKAPKHKVHSKGLVSALPAPKARSLSKLAASRMTMISNEPQPISCSRLSMAGRRAPLRPRLRRRAAMDDRPVSLPMTATAASSSTPTLVPMMIASTALARPRPGPSKAPVCSTIRPMPRENHKEQRSRPLSTRCAAVTG